MPITTLDRIRIQEALALAEQAIGRSEPNPRVGCILGREDGTVLAQGSTQAPGSSHAEADALAQARQQGLDLKGATAWVTLEPCAHHGRTPPCTHALIEAGLSRVVVGVGDPFEQVNGKGLAQLRQAGIEVVVMEGDASEACREMNIGFFSRIQRGRPWVRLKVAASLDGKTALENGRSQWITQEPARTDGHAFRRRAGAVLTGIGTVLEDDPRLDVRQVPCHSQPLRVVVDARLQTPVQARVLSGQGSVLIYSGTVAPAAQAALTERGAQVVVLPQDNGKVDLQAMLEDLGRRHINELHVEAGHKLNASLLRGGWVDELLVYLAPTLLGPGRDMAALPALQHLEEAQRWSFFDITPIGPDVRLRLRRSP